MSRQNSTFFCNWISDVGLYDPGETLWELPAAPAAVGGGAGRHFPQGSPGGVAILLDQEEDRVLAARVRGAGHHGGGAGVTDQLQFPGGPVRELDGVDVEPHDADRKSVV